MIEKRKCHSCDKEFDDERLNRIVSTNYEEKPPRYLCGPCIEKINNFIKANTKLEVLNDIRKYFFSFGNNTNILEKIENEIKDAYQKLIS